MARIYKARGQTESYAGRYSEAVGWYRKALSLGPADPDIIHGLADALIDADNYPEVEPLLERSLAIREKALGPEHRDVAQSLTRLAALYNGLGKYAEAEPLHQQALAIFEKTLGLEHPDVAISLESYANLLRKTDREPEAAALVARAKAIREKHAQENPKQ